MHIQIKRYIDYFTNKIKVIFYKLLFLFYSCNQDIVIVTGADSSHYKSLCQLLSSLLEYESKTKIVVYDLGLSDSEKDYINVNFPIELRLFNYSKYPKYLNIKINAGEYAWKPIILNNTMNEFKCCVCWLDAGNIVTEPLTMLRKFTERFGFYSPFSNGIITDWTHPKTLDFLKTTSLILNRRNLNGACVSVNYNNSKANNLI